MAWTSGFFNSVNGDRLYNADQLSTIFNGLITDGVYESVGNKLAVQPNNGMTIQVATGRGWFGGRWVNNDSPHLVTLENADVLLNRYCAVCVRVDKSASQRTADIYLKYSDLATTPTKPTMERTETVKEYCLAYIYIKGGATAITAADIQDTRADTSLCGWVTGLIEQVDTDTLWTQWEALFDAWYAQLQADTIASQTEWETEFDAWFERLQDKISESTEAQLIIDVANLKEQEIKATGTFDGLGWDSQDDGTYLQTITVQGVKADSDLFVLPSADYEEAYVRMGCKAISQSKDAITFSCDNPEDINLSVEVLIRTQL